MSDRLPALFVSHGAPLILLEDSPARRFLAGLGASVARPRAIVVASAHWETEQPSITVSMAPETIHDFFGFPEALYRIRYPAPGEPAVAGRVMQLLGEAGVQAVADYQRGLDHGAWVPLLLGWPKADVPVLQLSVQTRRGAAWHLALGAALSRLREEGVLVIGSGSATHDLSSFRHHRAGDPPEDYAVAFSEWLCGRVEAGDAAAVMDFRARGPHAARNHPTDEHFLPLLVAMGAGGSVPGHRIHAGIEYGAFAMDAYAFG